MYKYICSLFFIKWLKLKEIGRSITNKRGKKNNKNEYNDNNRQTAKLTIYIYTYTEIYMNIIDYLVYRANILLFRSFLFYTLVLVNVDVVSKELFIYVNEANSVWSIFTRSCLSQGVNWIDSLVNSSSKFDVSVLFA